MSSAKKIASRWLKATRPIAIDKPQVVAIAKDILRELPKNIVRDRFRPGGARGKEFSIGPYQSVNVLGHKVEAVVAVRFLKRTGVGMGNDWVVGARIEREAGKAKIILFLDAEKIESFKKPTSEIGVGILSPLLHEITHLHDTVGSVGSEALKAKGRYYNAPSEIRAKMQEVVDDVLWEAEKDPGKQLAVYLSRAPSWKRVEGILDGPSKKVILKGVFTALIDNRNRTAALAHKYLSRSASTTLGRPLC